MSIGLRVWEGNEGEFRRWGIIAPDVVRIGRAAGWHWTSTNGTSELVKMLTKREVGLVR